MGEVRPTGHECGAATQKLIIRLQVAWNYDSQRHNEIYQSAKFLHMEGKLWGPKKKKEPHQIPKKYEAEAVEEAEDARGVEEEEKELAVEEKELDEEIHGYEDAEGGEEMEDESDSSGAESQNELIDAMRSRRTRGFTPKRHYQVEGY